MSHTLTTCTFNYAGCGNYLETSFNKIIDTYPSISHPANYERTCSWGWHFHEIASATDYLTQPLIKKDNAFQPVPWNEARNFIVKRLTEIKSESGPNSNHIFKFFPLWQ